MKNEINLLKEELKEDESKNREELNRGIGEKNKSVLNLKVTTSQMYTFSRGNQHNLQFF